MKSVSDKPHEIIGAGTNLCGPYPRDSMQFAIKVDNITIKSIEDFVNSLNWKVIETDMRGEVKFEYEKQNLWLMADGTKHLLTDYQAQLLRSRRVIVTTDAIPFNTIPVRKV